MKEETKPCGTCGLSTMCIGENPDTLLKRLQMCPFCLDIFWVKSQFSYDRGTGIPKTKLELVLRANANNVCKDLRDTLTLRENNTHIPCPKQVCNDSAEAERRYEAGVNKGRSRRMRIKTCPHRQKKE